MKNVNSLRPLSHGLSLHYAVTLSFLAIFQHISFRPMSASTLNSFGLPLKSQPILSPHSIHFRPSVHFKGLLSELFMAKYLVSGVGSGTYFVMVIIVFTSVLPHKNIPIPCIFWSIILLIFVSEGTVSFFMMRGPFCCIESKIPMLMDRKVQYELTSNPWSSCL